MQPQCDINGLFCGISGGIHLEHSQKFIFFIDIVLGRVRIFAVKGEGVFSQCTMIFFVQMREEGIPLNPLQTTTGKRTE